MKQTTVLFVLISAVLRAQPIGLIDSLATPETQNLYENLRIQAENHLLFGMHDATGYGVGWNSDLDRSDVQSVCGDYPAVYSWDLTRITSANNEANTRYQMTAAYARGGINTMCWHQRDPLGRGFYAEDVNEEKIVTTLLPGGMYHDFYREKLRTAAGFFNSLEGSGGELIPVIFRPYHEHDGGWFWWGVGHCSREQYIDLWRFTVTFLRDSLDVHNLIYAYSPSSQSQDSAGYLDRYPGDPYVDILGLDHYFSDPLLSSEQTFFLERVRDVASMALARNKAAALTEVGQESLPTEDWFTRALLQPLKYDSLAAFIAYAAVWRNANTTHHYAPYPGHASVPDFLKFYEDAYTWFEADLPDMYTQPGPDTAPPEFTHTPETPFTASVLQPDIYIETDERADLRYAADSRTFDTMTDVFHEGQGTRFHTLHWAGTQNKTVTLTIHARDTLNNTTTVPLILTFTIDTLQAPVGWTDPRYPDSDWKSGAAPLGFGAVSFATPAQPARTLYFRRHFQLASIPEALGLLVKCHDGAVGYINGIEIGRINMNAGQVITHQTAAISDNAGNRVLLPDETAMKTLKIGDNVAAVEVHTANTRDTDISFDAQLFNATAVFFPLGSEWAYSDSNALPEAYTLAQVTGVTDRDPVLPGGFRLIQNAPNPFNPATHIRFECPRRAEVTLTLFDPAGRRIRIIRQGLFEAGRHQVTLHASGLSSGLYIVKLQAGRFQSVQKIMLIK